ncbi:PAS domain-containing sensor histidine kinase [Pedobacter hartonius]|uniref:histidine kinase n=1 Tax=Pedobacter hartonius TaxID=425514 RepID=A0A1H4H8S9_9SPHI|nr:PAS domain-containing sensor histidine kinase [Pedobacter hartonius]SEB18041.1 PAS domain S-box-containing protein [Pedobacter hartonius]
MDEENDLEFVNILKDQFLEYKQLNEFFMLSGDLLCIAGFDGYFKKINPAVSKLLGYTEQELFAKPINEFVYSDDKTVTTASRKQVYTGKALRNFENRYVTKDGGIVWLSWTSMPLPDQQLVLAIAKNVTEKKLQEEERNIFIDNLTKINQDLKQFTRMTSHDMRSPVSNLLAIFNLLDLSKIADNDTVELVKLLKTTSERLHETMNNFVDVMIKGDKLNVPIEKLNFEFSLDTVKSSVSSLIKDSGAAITEDFSACKDIFFNKIYLESILLNLITNAIKYARPGQVPLISIYTRIADETEQLIISDNGIGFDLEEVKDKIFGLYQVFHDRPDSKGIGLHLVYTHVTALGGMISVESKVNEGTIFTISFKR